MRALKRQVWPHAVSIKVSKNIDAPELYKLDEWCAKTVGRRFRDWYAYNTDDVGARIYAFKDEATLLVFKLTWGHYGTW